MVSSQGATTVEIPVILEYFVTNVALWCCTSVVRVYYMPPLSCLNRVTPSDQEKVASVKLTKELFVKSQLIPASVRITKLNYSRLMLRLMIHF